MKKILSFILCVFLISHSTIFMYSCNETGNNQIPEMTQTKQINITPNNYKEYFHIFVDLADFDMWESAISGTNCTCKLNIKCRSSITASYNRVILEGLIQLPLESTHLLYKEEKLPISITLNIDGTGQGECTAYFTYGSGPYGGWRDTDFYFECTSASGYIVLP